MHSKNNHKPCETEDIWPDFPKKLLQGKCTRCKKPNIIALPSHNARFCKKCFEHFFLASVERALKKSGAKKTESIAVAVSGGKDSLAAWEALFQLGYGTIGIHLDLGIEPFSRNSIRAARNFCEPRGLELQVHPLSKLLGSSIDGLSHVRDMETCALCGMVKRYYLNRLAVRAGAKSLATGHNLDDETGRLLGNTLRGKQRFLERFHPHLPSRHPRQAGRIKPLFRLDESEIAAYGILTGIVPVSGPACPHSKGATSRYYKEGMELLEEKMPGTKRFFLYDFLRNQPPPKTTPLPTCPSCGQPAGEGECSVCRFKARLPEKTVY